MRDLNVLLIHGDMHQSERNSVIQSFKRQEAPILVATDVASRGLDIPSIHNVINYEVACDIDTHTHRVGRTGRAGMKGTAYTLFVAGKDPVEFAACPGTSAASETRGNKEEAFQMGLAALRSSPRISSCFKLAMYTLYSISIQIVQIYEHF
ncbi:hypothetical protein AHF37_09049 [Paragonimus kellicotti]|nr:hypothetical protein AHF37_09049 [Paragonimus kellicotti]